MSSQQSGVWQTAGKPRHSQSASRTPQSRSGTASPNPQNTSSQAPKQEGGRQQQQTNNVWAQRSGGSNGQASADVVQQDDREQSVNGFNATEAKGFLSRDAASVTAYRPTDAAGTGKASGAWGSKPNHMANNQPFFVQLAKQIATLEEGG